MKLRYLPYPGIHGTMATIAYMVCGRGNVYFTVTLQLSQSPDTNEDAIIQALKRALGSGSVLGFVHLMTPRSHARLRPGTWEAVPLCTCLTEAHLQSLFAGNSEGTLVKRRLPMPHLPDEVRKAFSAFIDQPAVL